jgi:hypothetical protein
MQFSVNFRLDEDKDDVGQLTVRTTDNAEGASASWQFQRRIQVAPENRAAIINEIKTDFAAWVDRRKKERVLERALVEALGAERDRKMPPLGAEE